MVNRKQVKKDGWPEVYASSFISIIHLLGGPPQIQELL
jgi:hypothetical protein